MSFEIQTDLTGVRMYAGMIIQYKVRPVANIPMRWTTEITQAEDHRFFIDEQRFGPYRFWHHQHHFEPLDEHCTAMRDILHYKVGYGPVGALMNRMYIGNRLEEIFDYRAKAIAEIFPAPQHQEASPQ
jgi:ligand-binding SRPBCC domain-containing protein